MESLIFLLLIFIEIIAFAIFMAMTIDRFFVNAPFIPTPQKTVEEIVSLAPAGNKQIVIDLGCGDGRVLYEYEKKYGAKCIGYELGIWPWFLASVRRALGASHVQIIKGNLFNADLKDADIVYCYLFKEIMEALGPKFRKEMKQGSIVVSYDFEIPSWHPDQSIELSSQVGKKVHIYKI